MAGSKRDVCTADPHADRLCNGCGLSPSTSAVLSSSKGSGPHVRACHYSLNPIPHAAGESSDEQSIVIIENFREYLEELIRDGYSVRHDEHGSDPDLIDPGGSPIETWRADYPYEERMDREDYEREKYALQIELLKFQDWSQETGTKHV